VTAATLSDRYLVLFDRYLRPQAARAVLLAVLILGQMGLQLLSPQIVRSFIDGAMEGAPTAALTRMALLFLGVAVATQSLSLALTYIGQNVAWTATNALRRDLTLHCLRLDMAFHKAHAPGELIERIDGDVGALGNLLSEMSVRLFGNGLMITGIVVMLLIEEWRVGLAALGYTVLMLFMLRRIQAGSADAWRDSAQTRAELFGFLGERLTGAEDIRGNGAEPYVLARLHRLMRALLHAGRGAVLRGAQTFIVGYSAFMLVVIAALAIGAARYLGGALTIGAVYLLVSYANKLYGPLEEIQRQVADLQRASASSGRVNELLAIQPGPVERAAVQIPSGPLQVAFRGVTFRYPDGADAGDSVLTDVSLELAPGRVLGLLGRTGSGKTTLSRLLFRLYDPTAGAISLSGVDLRDVRLSELRRRAALVTQEVQLFAASVRDNLTLFEDGIPDDHILAALHELGLDAWFAALPAGLSTRLGAGGRNLSAGEAQLLAFARVYLRDPGLVILDEASSRLDPGTERILERAVDRLLSGRTAIIIAHRLATVGRADEVLVLEGGRIREHGDRRVLASDPASRFSALLRRGLEEVLA